MATQAFSGLVRLYIRKKNPDLTTEAYEELFGLLKSLRWVELPLPKEVADDLFNPVFRLISGGFMEACYQVSTFSSPTNAIMQLIQLNRFTYEEMCGEPAVAAFISSDRRLTIQLANAPEDGVKPARRVSFGKNTMRVFPVEE